MSKKKYYVVKRGRKTGIFSSWPRAQKQINHYPKAVFRGFRTKDQALHYWRGPASVDPSTDSIVFYTDGGCRNHGTHKGDHVKKSDPAAWACLIIDHQKRVAGTGFKRKATNNQMEMMAMYQAMRWLVVHHKNHRSILGIADSRYVLNAVKRHGWLESWSRQDWRLKSGRPVKNANLWKSIFSLRSRFSRLRFRWTHGHAGNPGNEFVDHDLNRTMDRVKSRQTRFLPPRFRKLAPLPGRSRSDQHPDPRPTSGFDVHRSRRSVLNLKRIFARWKRL